MYFAPSPLICDHIKTVQDEFKLAGADVINWRLLAHSRSCPPTANMTQNDMYHIIHSEDIPLLGNYWALRLRRYNHVVWWGKWMRLLTSGQPTHPSHRMKIDTFQRRTGRIRRGRKTEILISRSRWRTNPVIVWPRRASDRPVSFRCLQENTPPTTYGLDVVRMCECLSINSQEPKGTGW